MNVIAIIPARGGSKGIPNKNIVDFLGKPLLAWSILQAKESAVAMQGFRDAIPPRMTDSERQNGMAQISEILAAMR